VIYYVSVKDIVVFLKKLIKSISNCKKQGWGAGKFFFGSGSGSGS